MIEAFRVIVPTLNRVAHGTIWPAGDNPPTGIVLFDRTVVRPRAIQPLYRELAMYVQAAGMPALLVEPRIGADVTAHACDVLAAVTFMQSRGARRVILISTVDEGPEMVADVAGETLAGLVALMRRRYDSTAELTEATTALIATVRAVAGGVVGVAILSAPPPPQFATSSRSPTLALTRTPIQTWRDRETAGRETPAEAALSSLSELHLRLPGGGSGYGDAGTISQLYGWALHLHQRRGMDYADARARRTHPAASSPAEAETAETDVMPLRQLERDWEVITSALAARAPERASLARAAEGQRRERAETIVRGARYAWQHLDTQARQDWLHCCARIFGTAGSITHQAALNAAAIREHQTSDLAVAPTATIG